jgi:acetyl esterase/lipase
MDPLRDEGLIYEQVLHDNEVQTKVDLYPGFGHMFWTNFPRMTKSTEFVNDTLKGVTWLVRGCVE